MTRRRVTPLVLVECKAAGKGPDAGLGQARSYAFWLKPAYYVVTDGDYLTVWNYQGGAVPDVRTCEARRAALHGPISSPGGAGGAGRDLLRPR